MWVELASLGARCGALILRELMIFVELCDQLEGHKTNFLQQHYLSHWILERGYGD